MHGNPAQSTWEILFGVAGWSSGIILGVVSENFTDLFFYFTKTCSAIIILCSVIIAIIAVVHKFQGK